MGLKVLDWFLSCCSPHCQLKFQNHFAYLYLAFIKKLKKTVRCYFTFYSLLIGFRFFYVIISCKRALYQRVQLILIVSLLPPKILTLRLNIISSRTGEMYTIVPCVIKRDKQCDELMPLKKSWRQFAS